MVTLQEISPRDESIADFKSLLVLASVPKKLRHPGRIFFTVEEKAIFIKALLGNACETLQERMIGK